jgi:hypothetical protein
MRARISIGKTSRKQKKLQNKYNVIAISTQQVETCKEGAAKYIAKLVDVSACNEGKFVVTIKESSLKENNPPEVHYLKKELDPRPSPEVCVLVFGEICASEAMCSVRRDRCRQSSGMYRDQSRHHTLPWLPRRSAIQAPPRISRQAQRVRHSIYCLPSRTTRERCPSTGPSVRG